MKSEFKDNILTVFPDGKIDSYSALGFEKELFTLIDENKPEKIILDCKELIYIASAGLRVLLKAGRVTQLSIINVSRDVYEVLDTTGFTGMFDTKRVMREVSVEGCKLVGAGFSSEVYRYDKETVIKVFSEKLSLDRIYKETASAKKCFISGISTAIPYDVVRCGNRYGTVFELIDADTLSQNFMDHPENFDYYMEKYVELLKQFHSTPAIEGTFPDIKAKYHEWTKGLKKYMTDEEIAILDDMIDAVPDRKKMVHADCHSRNIMVQKDKFIFIDMADVSIGHPLFDIGAEYFHYLIFRTTCMGARVIFGVEPEDSELPVRIWYDLVRRYFDKATDTELKEIHKMLEYFGCLRSLITVSKHSQMEREAALELVNRQRKNLLPYSEEAKALFSRADEFFI